MDYKTAYERLYRAVGKYIMRTDIEMAELKKMQQEFEEQYMEGTLPAIRLADAPEPEE